MYCQSYCPVYVTYLVMQCPPNVFKTSIIKKALGVRFHPNTQLLNTHCTDLRQSVPVTVHKDTTESGVHQRGQLLSVLS